MFKFDDFQKELKKDNSHFERFRTSDLHALVELLKQKMPVPSAQQVDAEMKKINNAKWVKYAKTKAYLLKEFPGLRQLSAPVIGVVAPLVVDPQVALIRGIGTPKVVLATRGSTGTTVHLGLGEQVDLTLSAVPPIGTVLKWSVQGDAELTNQTPTSALLTAGPTAGNVSAVLKIFGGPSNGHKLTTLEFKVIAPTGTVTSQSPQEPLLRHTQGTAGIGFKMWVNLLPNTVVFSRLQWREHTGTALATGHFGHENGRVHAPTGVGYDANNQPLNELSATWMDVNGVHPPPHGINWVGQVDKVDTGDHPPDVAATGSTLASWKPSSLKWNIEWKYRVKKANGTFSGDFLLERTMHEAKLAADGTATIKKGNAGPFTRAPNAGTSGYA